ncbi:hypothetical protein [Insolitispirillum peregrinum]|uniref:hypothetical protein n=1 Tax=Insolitispirillum peregrinum TaxID=80876 RepID=UPI00361E4AA7
MRSLPAMVDISVEWAPLLPWSWWAVACAVMLALSLPALWRRAPGSLWRLAAFVLLALGLANPQMLEATRTPVPDVAVVVVDDSASQSLADRPQQTAAAEQVLREQLAKDPTLETRVVRLSQVPVSEPTGTRLFAALERAISDIPRQRLAGAILITDGQAHDIPPTPTFPAPVHTLLTGQRGETDRRMVVDSAPSFGLVGATVTVTLRIDDPTLPAGSQLPLTLRSGQSEDIVQQVSVNTPVTVTVPVAQAGLNVIDASVPARPHEPSISNNRAVLSINGVRDRLRVLLISGEPHIGERAWRSLLKADPNVDLVHFTIMRLPQKEDPTPLNELSLIPFPIRELFEERLDDFDLVIFDRYSQLGLIPLHYLGNVANYVRDGGAVMLAVGPEYAGVTSLYDTPLADILPAAPTGTLLTQSFTPQPSAVAARHPITAPLIEQGASHWGPWLRATEATTRSGVVLLTGPDQAPLLVVDHVGKGRIGLLLSDTVWLWGKGWEGGGPQQELIRRLAHWLMAEPELEENALLAHLRPATAGTPPDIEVLRRSLDDPQAPLPALTVTAPDGHSQTLALTPSPTGASARFPAPQTGGWAISDGTQRTMVAVTTSDPLEEQMVVATPDRLRPLADASGGGVFWLSEQPPAITLPAIRRPTASASAMSGSHWLGLRRNGESTLQGLHQTPLLPAPLLALLFLTGMFIAWRREGR